MSEFPDNVVRLRQMIRHCTLCPRGCGVDREAGQLGACRTGAEASVASWGAHFGEESVLVGPGGSGTIFLERCNLECVFCQNSDISHPARHASPPASSEHLAELALRLESGGCANVNFVSPTHVAHAVAEAIVIARGRGLGVPVVYNCGGYEAVETLGLLDGLVEVYMPDFKYASAEAGLKYSGVSDYPAAARAALAEMYAQVGPLQLDRRGLARGGLLVRHLVMPGDLAGSRQVIDAVAETAPLCTINVMGQYRPAWRADRYEELAGLVSSQAVRELRDYARTRGLVACD
ncbi:MAG: hypothetical protein BWX88_02453 [Planctomycetes bacterium ADurb.Bin126]|mgnify:FL=1|nr:MAG: hypothetical protein BWX88_02453 [Planctomycetes bacterium ADurb.Bin126]HOD81189.1 radical SAM protein [Phycisphaerae bacterium]HQL72450.1 radical SAM protein [Phycisphaerae bacterium]